jgi:hypothetical protein
MRRAKIVLLGIVIVLVGIQVIPVRRTNPPPTGEIRAPEEVMAILKRSCYDCHSNETTWPWYSHVAPVSWLIVNDVSEGRGHVNFSQWAAYSAREKARREDGIVDEVSSGGMPLKQYLLMHREARLTRTDVDVLTKWAKGGSDASSEEAR